MAGGWHERPRARDEGRPWHKRAPMRDLFGTKGIRCTKKAPNRASIGLCATLFAHSQAFAPASPPRRRRRPSRQPLPSPPLLRPILPPLLLRLKAIEGVPIRFQARRGGAEEERGEGGKEAERVGQAMNERGPNDGQARADQPQSPLPRLLHRRRAEKDTAANRQQTGAGSEKGAEPPEAPVASKGENKVGRQGRNGKNRRHKAADHRRPTAAGNGPWTRPFIARIRHVEVQTQIGREPERGAGEKNAQANHLARRTPYGHKDHTGQGDRRAHDAPREQL